MSRRLAAVHDFRACAREECGRRVQMRPNRKYCSDTCKWRVWIKKNRSVAATRKVAETVVGEGDAS